MLETTSDIKLYILKLAYYLLPNLEKFNIRNDVVYEKVPTLLVISLTIVYALCYALIIFLLARINLKKKEF